MDAKQDDLKAKIMQLVREICNTPSTNCRSLNKSLLARELLDIANVPQNAEIQEIPLDWDNQVVILFLIPDDVIYYSLFAGIGKDGNFYFDLTVTGILRENQFESRFEFISDEISLDLNYFKTADENAKKEIEREVNARIQAEIDDIKETNDSLLAWFYSGF